MDFCSGQGANHSNSSTIARICNAVMDEKTRFYVPDSVQHHARGQGEKAWAVGRQRACCALERQASGWRYAGTCQESRPQLTERRLSHWAARWALHHRRQWAKTRGMLSACRLRVSASDCYAVIQDCERVAPYRSLRTVGITSRLGGAHLMDVNTRHRDKADIRRIRR